MHSASPLIGGSVPLMNRSRDCHQPRALKQPFGRFLSEFGVRDDVIKCLLATQIGRVTPDRKNINIFRLWKGRQGIFWEHTIHYNPII